MFGRKPRLPFDTVFLSDRPDSFVAKKVSDYISDLRKRMEETRLVVKQHLERTKKKQAKYYNRKAKTVLISKGDRVLVRRVAFDGMHKLADTYEDDIYIVVCQMNPDVSVYCVLSGYKEKVLHQNLLYLVDHQDLDEDGDDTDDETDEGTRKEVSTVKKSDVTYDQDDSDSRVRKLRSVQAWKMILKRMPG